MRGVVVAARLDSPAAPSWVRVFFMKWYYAKNGSQLGPIDEAELRAKLDLGEVAASDLVWREGLGDWLPAGKLKELFPVPPLPAAAPPIPPLLVGAGIPNYLWQSILVTIFCCWPLGIPAIVYAAKVDGLQQRGDLAGARTASTKAKHWCIVAAGSFLVGSILWLIFALLMAVFGGGSSHY